MILWKLWKQIDFMKSSIGLQFYSIIFIQGTQLKILIDSTDREGELKYNWTDYTIEKRYEIDLLLK